MLKKHFISCLKISVAVVIVWYLLYSRRLTLDNFSQLLDPVHLPLLFMSGAAFIAAQMLAAYRLVLLLRMIDLRLSYFHVFKLTMIGSFFNIVIPGMVGGDIVKGAYLFKSEEDRHGRSSGIVLMDRVMGFLALLFIGAISIIYLYLLKRETLLPYINELKVVILTSVGVLMFFALFVLIGRKRQFRVKAKAIASTLFKNTIFYHMTDAIGALTKRRRVLAKAFCISLGVQAIALAGLLILIRLVPGNLPDIAALTAVSSIVLLFGIIPLTPGNIGWTELVASIGWSVVGSAAGGIIFFYWRIVSILFSLPGGLLYLLPGNDILWRHAEATDPGETAQK
jgi:uncharacterized protein (TIRG00374 family)